MQDVGMNKFILCVWENAILRNINQFLPALLRHWKKTHPHLKADLESLINLNMHNFGLWDEHHADIAKATQNSVPWFHYYCYIHECMLIFCLLKYFNAVFLIPSTKDFLHYAQYLA